VYPKIQFFIQVVHGRPGGRLQFFGGSSKMAWIAIKINMEQRQILRGHPTPYRKCTYRRMLLAFLNMVVVQLIARPPLAAEDAGFTI